MLENNCWVPYTSNPILLLGSQNGVFQFSHSETNHTRALNDPDGKPFVKAFEISTIVLFHGWILVGVLLQSVMLKQSVKLSSREMTEERIKGNEHTNTLLKPIIFFFLEDMNREIKKRQTLRNGRAGKSQLIIPHTLKFMDESLWETNKPFFQYIINCRLDSGSLVFCKTNETLLSKHSSPSYTLNEKMIA